ncbi:right-handed parallel beta-helix repeat-containing protein, partial [Methanobrevibacter thaueri]|uniref:right-handed parallel beta-helix repeat-containing protein n=1 Tax=Methanobrevibacter thaueri TaxID=190975 RepID=UPI001057BCE0
MDELQISEDDEILSVDHDLSGSTLQQIQQYFDNGNVAEGDTVYLGNNDITSSWSDYNGGPINVNVANIVISGGSISNPNGFSTINANTGKVFSFNAPGITLNNVRILNSNGGNGPASALYIDASDCTINNCLFDNCQYQGGGAVHISDEGTNTAFNNCNFTNNVGRHSNSGGAVFIEANDCEFTGCNFEENTAAHGGAIHVASGGNLKIDSCNFTENTAETWGYGGAINIVGDGTGFTITNSKFKKNSGGMGGAIHAGRPELTVINSEFEENTATNGNIGGGAIDIAHDDASLTNCNFTGNSAVNGGAIYIEDDCHNADMSYCNFTDNTANSGKAIYAYGSADGKVSNCELGGVTDLSVVAGYPVLTFTLATDYSNIVVGNIEGASGEEGSKVPLPNEEIQLEIRNSNGDLVDTVTDFTDSNGQITYDYSHLPMDSYTYTATYLDGKTKEGTFGIVNVEGDAFSDIQRAIDNAEAGAILMLKDITYLNDISDEMVINKPISIIGVDGTVLNAEGKSGIFTINNVDGVTLQGITFINGDNTDYGGAIDVVGSTNGVVDNCTFINNTANIGGGAVRVNNDAAGWNFYNSTFINNTALSTLGDGRGVPNGGGAIWSCVQEVSVYGSSFINNSGSYGGALRGSFNTYDSELINNTAFNGNGGGIDVTIDDIVSPRPSLRYINTTFIGNTAKGDRADERAQGGALHMYHIEHVDIVDCECYNNTADRGGAVDLFIIATVSVENSTFENNTAISEGGGFFINATSSPTEFRNSDISNNRAGTDGGAIYLITEGAFFDNITSNNNTAARGGSSFIRGNNAVIQNSTFCNNSAIYNGNEESGIGGGLDVLGNNCRFTNVTANNNNASLGGAAFIRGDNTLVDNCTLNNNNATLRGGGLNVAGDNCNVNNVDVSNNRAGTDGGAVYVKGNDATFVDVYSFNNTANRGGSTFVDGNNADVHNCTLVGNNAYNSSSTGLSGRGGGLDLAGDNCKVYDLEVSNNHADGEGGAVYIKSSNLNIYDINSVNNTAQLGGSTFIEGNNIVVHNCTLDGNNATLRGGGLNILGNNCTVYDVDVSDNNAGTDGGAVYVKGNDATFYNVTSFNNTASRGGSTFIEGDNALVHNCTLDGNQALSNGSDNSGRGGALDIAGKNCQVYDLDVSNNHADNDGGAMYIKSNDLEVYDIHSVDNSANRGGSTFIEGNNTVVHDCIFDGNNATLRGGGLNILGDNCTVYNVDVSDNYASAEGGAVYVRGNDATFTNVTSVNNTAAKGGSTFIEGNNADVHNCTLDGNKALYNGTEGSGRGGGIDIAGDDCKVYDLEVSNNHADREGGAIYIKTDDLNIYEIDSLNNTASRGGSVFIEGNNITVSNSTFSNNQAIFNESDPDNSGIGGAIDVFGNDCKFINVTSVNNTAYRGGSTFIRGNNTIIKDCILDNNTATLRGGGLNIAGDNCTIENVDVSNNNAGLMGGAIYVNSNGTTLTNIVADNNTAERGGAAFINGTNIIVRDGELNNNKAIFNESNPEASGLGGGFDIVGDNILVDNVHSNNNSAYLGGSTFIRGDNVTVQNCNLDNNSATLRGGGINIAGDGCNVENVSVSNNKAGLMGGAIYVNSNGTTLTNVIADNNTAERGGAAFINGTNIIVRDGELNNNRAIFNESRNETSGLGGGFDIVGDNILVDNVHSNNNSAYLGGSTFIRGSNVTVQNSNLDNNSATLRGGALNIGGGEGCQILNVSLSNNEAGTLGGAVYVVGDKSVFDNVTSVNNTAQEGGSSYIAGDEVVVKNCNLNNNSATINGGGLDVAGNNCTFVNVTLSDCNAAKDGGAVYVKGNNTVFDNVTSIHNHAERGGSSFIEGNNIIVKNSDLNNNTADVRGGGLDVAGDNCTFVNVTLSNCNATEEGGAVYIRGNENVFENVTSVNNHAYLGGSTYVAGDDNVVKNCTLVDNTADFGGGAIAIEGSNSIFTGNNISRNSAYMGGAIYIDGDNSLFTYNNITFNEAHNSEEFPSFSSGGAMAIQGANTNFTHNNISSNLADETGGAMVCYGENLYMEDIYAFNNTAENGGFAQIMYANDLIIKNSTFYSNHATGDIDRDRGEGGAIHVSYSENIDVQGNFTYNTATNGSAIYVQDSTLRVHDSSFFDNQAKSYLLIIDYDRWNSTANCTVKGVCNCSCNCSSHNTRNRENTMNSVHNRMLDSMRANGMIDVIRASSYDECECGCGCSGNCSSEGKCNCSCEDFKYIATIYEGENITIIVYHKGGDNIANAIYNQESDVTVNNISYPFYAMNGTEIIKHTPAEDINPVIGPENSHDGEDIYQYPFENNQIIRIIVYDEGGNVVKDVTYAEINKTDIYGATTLLLQGLKKGNYTVEAIYRESTYYTAIENRSSFRVVPHELVEKITLNSTVFLGEEVQFVIVLNNTFNETLHNITVTEIFNSSQLQLVDYINHTQWTRNGTVFTYNGSLSTNESAYLTVIFKTLVTGTIINTVNVTTNETGNKTFQARNETKVLKLIDKLTVNKTVYVGEEVQFVIVVNNTNDIILHNVTVTEIFNSTELQFVNYTNQDKWSRNGNVFTYDGSLAANECVNFTVIFKALVNGTLINTVNLTTNETGNQTDTASNNTTAYKPNMTVEKVSLNITDFVVVNDTVAFNITVTNTGDCVLGSVNVTDVFNDSEFRYLGFVGADWSVSQDNRTFFYGQDLGIGANATFTIYFKALVNGTLVNNVTARSNVTNDTNDTANVTVYSPNMTVVKVSLNITDFVIVNDTVAFNITVTNTGDCVLGSVNVTEQFDANKFKYLGFVGADWSVSQDNRTFFYGQDLGIGANATFTVYFKALVNGTLVNNVTARSNVTNDTNDTANVTVYSPNMTVVKVSLNITDFVVVNDTVAFNITVTNTGDCVLGNVTVTEFFKPSEFRFIRFVGADWSSEDNVTFKYLKPLGLNGNATFTVYFQALTNGTLVNNVTAKSNVTNDTNDTANVTVYSPNMTVVKVSLNITDFVVVNDTVAFNITVTNTGDCVLGNVT